MIKSIDELKELAEWARSKRISHLKIGDVELSFSNMAFVDGLLDGLEKAPSSVNNSISNNVDINFTEPQKEDEEILYYSANG